MYKPHLQTRILLITPFRFPFRLLSMIKIYVFILFTLPFYSCHSQTNCDSAIVQGMSAPIQNNEKELAGVIYFSSDHGDNWMNTSQGLPEQVSIGLGGIAASDHQIGVATKENGVYLYNSVTRFWEPVPTDKQITEGNIGAMSMLDHQIFVGTQYKGVFRSGDRGKTWTIQNKGLTSLTIRRFCEFNQKLYVCTNDGFYSFNEKAGRWVLEYGHSSLQVNGATQYRGSFCLATDKGIIMQQKDNTWINVAPHLSVHHISSDLEQIYAMTYNELLLSSFDGKTWQSQQTGLPETLYTFNVIRYGNTLYAAQWDGVYRKTGKSTRWNLSGAGLPANFAVTNLLLWQDVLVISTSVRKLQEGMPSDQ